MFLFKKGGGGNPSQKGGINGVEDYKLQVCEPELLLW